MIAKQILAAAFSLTVATPAAAAASPAAKPAIILVHGAFADAAGWGAVISILQRDGYQVTAVENPLESFAGDVATTQRTIAAQSGPVVLVGHSYGGAVITEAAADKPNVKALVYIAAIAPDAGEPINAFLDKYPSLLGPALRPDPSGFLTVDRGTFRQVFAGDLTAADAAVAAATQKPIKGDNFGATPAHAAWKTIPSWYVVSRQDHALSPDLERFYAKRMGARTSELDASHVAFISQPQAVARVIEEAAASVH